MIMPSRGRMALLAALASLCGSVAVAQSTLADLEYSLSSPKDPHPVTYLWNGEARVVKEPGPNFYYFFYTGVVGDDARVGEDVKIERIPVSLDEWTANRRYLIAKLTLYYQLTNNQTPTALRDLTSEAPVEAEATPTADQSGTFPSDPNALQGTFPGDPNAGLTPSDPNAGFGGGGPASMPGLPGGDPNFGMQQQPQSSAFMPGMGMPAGGALGSAGGFVGSAGANAFNPRAAAEWTFYYDQYVLWQYYCARVLLKQEEDLLDPEGGLAAQEEADSGTGSAGATSARGGRQTNPLLAQAAQSGPVQSGGSISDILANRPTGGGGGQGGGGIGGFIDSSTGDFYAQRGAASTPGLGAAGPGGNELLDQDGKPILRQQFDPQADWARGTYDTEERDRFIDAAQQTEQDLYRSFIEMINRIDEREINNEQYQEWLQTKRQQVFNYAESWRQLSEGDSKMIDDRLYLITDEPLEAVPADTINVQRAAQLTPQDLLDAEGTLRKPAVE